MPGGILGFGSTILQGKQRSAADAVPPLIDDVNINTPAFRLTNVRSGDDVTTRLRRLTDPANNSFSRAVPGLLANFSRLGRNFGSLRGDLAGLRRDNLGGAVSAFRRAGLDAFKAARQSAASNLSQSLARRNVLGSSFGQDALSRLRAEFGQKTAEFEADTLLRELGLERDIIGQQAGLLGQEGQTVQQQAQTLLQENQVLIQRFLADLQELGVAAGLPIQVQQLLNQNAALKASAILGDEGVSLGRDKLTFEVAKKASSFIGGGLGGAAGTAGGAFTAFGGGAAGG